jgi:hypothetical protein
MNAMMTRRQSLKLLAGAALAAVSALSTVNNALAGITWCRVDPFVKINGVALKIYPERDSNAANICNGPIKLNFVVPPDADCRVINADQGFGYGYDISFTPSSMYSGNIYRVNMYVPAPDSSMAVRLTCNPLDPSSTTTRSVGTSNSWVTVTTRV